jgi:glycosyltransferase involved in cell wall biosynthesis
VHTPARYAWFPELDDRASGNPAARALGAHIRRMDRRAAARVVGYAANSEATRQRIAQVWGRDARVIHPPTDLSRFEGLRPTEGATPYLLGLSRFIPYKRLDFVIEVAEAAGMPAVIVGSGHLEATLRARAAAARVPVRVVTDADDTQVVRLLADATALVYPAVEDFGLVPVEAMAAGTPVLALDVAGTKETVRDGVSGYLLPSLDAPAWAERVAALDRLDPEAVRRRGHDFGVPAFRRQVEAWIAEEIG